MNRNLVFQCDNSENMSLKFFDYSPEPIAVFLSCGSLFSGCSKTRMHHSFFKYGRLRSTSFSKYSVNRYSGTFREYSRSLQITSLTIEYTDQ
jgi:hypothetical protein